MRYYKQNNLVQLLPFLCLLAAAALTTLGAAAARLPRWLGRCLATLATLAFLGYGGLAGARASATTKTCLTTGRC